MSTTFSSGGFGPRMPAGPPEWPRPGGMLKQSAVVVEIVELLTSEWSVLVSHEQESKPAKTERRPRPERPETQE